MDIKEIKNLYLHDFELQNVMCNYKEKNIEVILKSRTQNLNIVFDGATLCNITFSEPWGAGYYVYGVELKNEGIVILLNSGDEIYIVAETFSYLQE